jgi:uncharacterized membrane protein YvlD (DUF360 family)
MSEPTNAPAPVSGSAAWEAAKPKLSPVRVVLGIILSMIATVVAAWILPGFDVKGAAGAFGLVVLIAVLNAIVPPVIAALRVPYTIVFGFLTCLVLDAAIVYAAGRVLSDVEVSGFGDALLASILIAALTMLLQVFAGVDDVDSATELRRTQRIARRVGKVERTDVPGIIYLEIDGLALPVLRRAMRDGNAPVMARWLASGDYRLLGWEPDLSSQTGASQAGILLGSNEDIPAFRWVEKETGRLMTCSAPQDCMDLEQRLATGIGLLIQGGASRGNLLSGEAEACILTVSRINEEKRANPGYRAFFASAQNVSRALALFFAEVAIEWSAALRAIRRDVLPRGHRGGAYPFIRAAMCVIVRDLIVQGVLSDMMAGRPAIYATFSSYDEVAHHSGLERADTLEALRKLDKQFGRIERARKYAPRPYEIVVLSDHGQTQGATFLQRNGYSLDDLVRRALESGTVTAIAEGDESATMVGTAFSEATGRAASEAPEKVEEREVAVLGSGNLGLIYLLDVPHRMTLEEISERHPRLIDALRSHPHVGWLLVRSAHDGALVLGRSGHVRLRDGHVEGNDPLAPFGAGAAHHLARTDGFPHVADIMVGSFYDPDLEEGCAFEELISFHGGLGGPQTKPFVLAPASLPQPTEPLVGAAAVHGLLFGWRWHLQPREGVSAAPSAEPSAAG